MTLESGDVPLSGTPAGTDRLGPGNVVAVSVEGHRGVERSRDGGSMVRAVRFDVDDTLTNYTESMPHSLRVLFGVDADPRRLAGVGRRAVLALPGRHAQPRDVPRARARQQLTSLVRPVWGAAELGRMEQERALVAGVRLRLYLDLLPRQEVLRADDAPLALLSNADGQAQRRRLEVLGTTDVFDVVALSGETGWRNRTLPRSGTSAWKWGSPTRLSVGDNPVPYAASALETGNRAVLICVRCPSS